MDKVIHQGDLYWYTSAENGQMASHPHVVLQADELNRSRIHSVVVCGLSTHLQKVNQPGNVLLETGEGNLPAASLVVVTQVSAVDEHALGEYIGTLSRERVSQILAGMRFIQTLSDR